ncbi:unnamed protein product [Protopolystoma xenopodis]|uniref:Uncharacterized protein n=1 Tax=Protopolystoma xenopodis TaxID=117903 RepID=A0A3S5FE82_9PLAT|nr:unnamed protein product [Protopolystoma xenopodis]
MLGALLRLHGEVMSIRFLDANGDLAGHPIEVWSDNATGSESESGFDEAIAASPGADHSATSSSPSCSVVLRSHDVSGSEDLSSAGRIGRQAFASALSYSSSSSSFVASGACVSAGGTGTNSTPATLPSSASPLPRLGGCAGPTAAMKRLGASPAPVPSSALLSASSQTSASSSVTRREQFGRQTTLTGALGYSNAASPRTSTAQKSSIGLCYYGLTQWTFLYFSSPPRMFLLIMEE